MVKKECMHCLQHLTHNAIVLTSGSLYVMNKSGYDFRIQHAEIDKEDIKNFKQWNHCRPVLFYITMRTDKTWHAIEFME
jgi:hypothetical protein